VPIFPQNIKAIDKLIKNEVQEDLHLDYKASPALDKNKRDDISKDVSAFANSDGGTLIYGIIEKDNLPISKDSGVENKKMSREQLEQIISSNITPRIDGIKIKQIPLSTDRSIFVVSIPKSHRAPHQARDKKYYKRFNFESTPMEDYEISDVSNRRNTTLPLINVDIEARGSFAVYFKVSNIGNLPAYNVSFSIPDNIRWRENREAPTLFTRGTKYFPPQRTFYFFWNTFPVLFHSQDENDRKCEITVTYLHPQNNSTISDTFYIDLDDYRDGSRINSDIEDLKEMLKEQFKKLTDEVKKLNGNFEKIMSIGGNTGLDLSVTTLKNLKNMISGDGKLEKINPSCCSYKVFKEVLNIDYDLAFELEMFFRRFGENRKLEDVKGITPEIINKIKDNFEINE
jgi:hypothetical protein